MSRSSKIAYADPNNIVQRISHREIIFKHFKQMLGPYTIREVSKVVKLPYNACQKRMSELLKSNLIREVGRKEENGQANTLYELNSTPELFPNRRKGKYELLREVVEKLCPDRIEFINKEFERKFKK